MNAWSDKWDTLSVSLPAQTWSDQPWAVGLSRFVARVILISLVLVLAWQSAVLLWLLLEENDAQAIAPAKQPSVVRNQPAVPAIYDLFAGAAKPPAPAPKPKPVAPKNLRLTLQGVYATDDPKQGFGLISSAKKKPQTYRVGDTIKSGVTLKEVYADRVLLSRNGELISLVLLKDTKGITQTTSTKPMVSGALGEPVIVQEKQVLRKLNRYRQGLKQNPMAMGRLIRGSPVMRHGHIYGVKVSPGTDPLLINQVGLKQGDVLVDLNGTAFNDIKNLPTLIKTLSEDNQFDITVERDGDVRILSVYLEM